MMLPHDHHHNRLGARRPLSPPGKLFNCSRARARRAPRGALRTTCWRPPRPAPSVRVQMITHVACCRARTCRERRCADGVVSAQTRTTPHPECTRIDLRECTHAVVMLRLVLLAPSLVGCHARGDRHLDSFVADSQQWAGTISFDDSRLATVGVPLNVTVTGQSAAVTWFFSGEGCREQYQPSLVFSETGNAVTLLGCGGSGENCSGAQNFYTFAGTATAAGGINGTVFHPPYPEQKQRVGSFKMAKVSATNTQQPPQCRGHGPAPPTPPAPGPVPHPDGPNPPALWPAPARYHPAPSSGSSVAIIDASALSLSCTGSDACESSIAPAFARGKAWALAVPDADSTGATLRSVVVRIAEAQPLQLGVNESYTLQVTSTRATITAPTQWGALHAVESFFQLVLIEPWEECPNCRKYIMQPDVPFSLVDQPRTQWRGLMIDTGTPFLSMRAC